MNKEAAPDKPVEIPNARDYRFDNLKGILIFMVVFNHTAELLFNGVYDKKFIYSIFSVFSSLHMPVFIFISGYFSKKIKTESMGRVCEQTLIPFLVFNLFYWIIGSRNISTFFYPTFAMWFLLSLFFWKVLVIPVSRFRFSLILTILMSLYIGVTDASKFMSMHRTIAFFPYFMAGFLADESLMKKIQKLPKYIPLLVGAVGIGASVFLCLWGMSSTVYSVSVPYKELEQTWFTGISLRAVALVIGFAGIFWTYALASDKPSWLSTLGKNSIVVYFGHVLAIKGTREVLKFLGLRVDINTVFMLAFDLVFSIAVCFILGNSFVSKIYHKCMDFITRLFVRSKTERSM